MANTAPKVPQMSDREARAEIHADDLEALERGRHQEVAARLSDFGRHDLAGWVFEQIWDYRHAAGSYLAGERPFDAIRVALLSRDPKIIEETTTSLFSNKAVPLSTIERIGRWLGSTKRGELAARFLLHAAAPAPAVAKAYEVSGDHLRAVERYLEAGEASQALSLLGSLPGTLSPALLARKAQALWQVGDLESAARVAQVAIAAGCEETSLRQTLAQSLVALGYPLAARFVLAGAEESPSAGMQRAARYRIKASAPAVYSGVSYLAQDRSTLEDVEIHLLAADVREVSHPNVQNALQAFAARARAGAAIGHPAIRPILALDERDGVLVLPQSAGPGLRSWIRPGGFISHPEIVIAAAIFLGEGLASAHSQGLVHGSILPSQMVSDSLGRPILGPFGAHLLAGLNATRTGTLEELLVLSAPEARSGAQPTTASDVFALGKLIHVILAGTFSIDATPLPSLYAAPIEAMCQVEPGARPSMETALEMLRHSVERRHPKIWASLPDRLQHPLPSVPQQRGLLTPVVVRVHASWSEHSLAAMCSAIMPGVQAILDRSENEITLLAWPDRSVFHPFSQVDSTRQNVLMKELAADVPPQVMVAASNPQSQAKLRWAEVPSGEWMLDLEELLAQPVPPTLDGQTDSFVAEQ